MRVAEDGDRGAVRAFLDRLSASTIRARYLSPATRLVGALGDRELKRLMERDAARHVVVLAVDGTDVRGVGEFVTEDVGAAEVAFVVEDAFQGHGIGRRLVRRLDELARERGIRSFTGDVAYGNVRAAALLRGTGRRLQMLSGSGGVRFRLLLEAQAGGA